MQERLPSDSTIRPIQAANVGLRLRTTQPTAIKSVMGGQYARNTTRITLFSSRKT